VVVVVLGDVGRARVGVDGDRGQVGWAYGVSIYAGF
jgi:hypothetical protein